MDLDLRLISQTTNLNSQITNCYTQFVSKMLHVHALQAANLEHWHFCLPMKPAAVVCALIHLYCEPSFEQLYIGPRHIIHETCILLCGGKFWLLTLGAVERAQMVACCLGLGQINPIPDASAELL